MAKAKDAVVFNTKTGIGYVKQSNGSFKAATSLAEFNAAKKASGGSVLNITYNPKTISGGSSSSTSKTTATTTSSTASFKNSSSYKALSSDLKSLVDLSFYTFSGTPEQQKIFADALVQAQELADPYAKSQLSLAETEFKLAIAKTNNDYVAQQEILTRGRKDIADTLKLNQDYLSLEQTASMAKELKGYDEDLLSIADQAAEKGITFASGARSRALSEERRGEQYQDVIQSNQRTYNFKVKELELKAAQGDADAQRQLEDLPKQKEFALQKIGQSAERVLGSSKVGDLGIEGFTAQGGALGSIEQERRQAIINAASLGITQAK